MDQKPDMFYLCEWDIYLLLLSNKITQLTLWQPSPSIRILYWIGYFLLSEAIIYEFQICFLKQMREDIKPGVWDMKACVSHTITNTLSSRQDEDTVKIRTITGFQISAHLQISTRSWTAILNWAPTFEYETTPTFL